MIYKITQYIDDEGKLVIAHEPVNSNNSLSISIQTAYFGVVQFETNVGPVKAQFEFTEETTLSECFENFAKRAEEFFDKIKAKQNSNLIMPDDAGQIIIPK